MIKRLLLLFMTIVLILTTGCWDMLDINDRIYPYTMGFDLNKDRDVQQERYNITISYPNFNAMGKNANSDKLIYAVSVPGNSMFDAQHRLTTKTKSPLYLKHLKVVILSEEIAKDRSQLLGILDGIFRDFVTNNNVQLLVTKQPAKEIIEKTLISERQAAVEGPMYSMLINNQHSVLFSPIDAMGFIENTDVTGSSTIPMVSVADEIYIEGAAVFTNYKFVGYLDHHDQRAINYINGTVKQDSVETDYKGTHLAIMVSDMHSKLQLEESDKNIKIKIPITIEGYLHQYNMGEKFSIETEDDLEKLQEAAAKTIKAELDNAIVNIQDMGADIIYVGSYLRMHNPDIWAKVKDNWDEIFKDIEIEIEVKVLIRRRGIIK